MFYRSCFALRRLPWYSRLFIVLLSFAIFEIPVAYLMDIGADRSVAAILFFAGILAALLFKWHKAFIVQCMLLSSHIAVVIAIKGYNYPSIPVIVSGTISNFFIIWTVGMLRRGWELAEEALEQQKNLSAMKDQFVVNVDHEMRNPIMCVAAFVDVLRESDDLSIEERKMFLDRAAHACDNLQRVAENILDAMRVDSDVPLSKNEDFDLGAMTLDVVQHIDVDHLIHIDIDKTIMACGNSQQVTQVMRNLISNALKYAPKGSFVTVKLWQDDAFAYVCVQDRGPGIAPDQIPFLFQKFSRLERDIAGPIRGTGLGLYICRRFVENMGGRIWVESTGVEGEGSSFYFSLPLGDDSNNQSMHRA